MYVRLTYRLEACPLRSSDNNSLDFAINRLFMKLVKTNNLSAVTYCRTQFNFDLLWNKEVMLLLVHNLCNIFVY